MEDGYEFFAGRRLVTIFSAPDYIGQFDNDAAVMVVDERLCVSFKTFTSKSKPHIEDAEEEDLIRNTDYINSPRIPSSFVSDN